MSRKSYGVLWLLSVIAQVQSVPYYWRGDLTHSADWQLTAIVVALWALLAERWRNE